jgi:NAD(P)-dependent dehydrogenase (short-subunit alcohol dehydrogenase family)
MGKLNGKVAIVTGGGQGVGLGVAFALAEAGATLVITGRHEEKLRAAAEQIRVKRESAQHTVRATIERFGRLDVLVNNAQGSSPGVLFATIDYPTIAMTLESVASSRRSSLPRTSKRFAT